MLSLNTVTTAIEDYYQNMRRRDGDKRKSGLVPLIIDKEGSFSISMVKYQPNVHRL